MTVLFVEYPKCSTCKKAKAWLDEHGVEYIDRDIVLDNPTADELATWIAHSGLPVRRFFGHEISRAGPEGASGCGHDGSGVL